MKIQSCLFLLLATLGGLLLSGCATTSSNTAPGADLARIKKIYVVHLPADERGINQILADQLGLMGFQATTGEAPNAPGDEDAILTYQDKWMWDITMYMIEINVQLRQPKTEMMLATARSYRPSLQRKSPPEMAKEVLNTLFKR